MKSVLISIQPYWLFLIIAEKMGWRIDKKKTVEVRKNYPKDENWDEVAKIYCSKDKKSFDKIPKKYQPFMEQFLGKVIGEFVCDSIRCEKEVADGLVDIVLERTSCVSARELVEYANGNVLYSWHISNLVIYDKPKSLREFKRSCPDNVHSCAMCRYGNYTGMKCTPLTRPPQSWCYVEGE